MLRSGPGPATVPPPTSTVPSVAGKCGRSPAMSRSTVDLPHPEGPRMQTNSPLPGRSSTVKLTLRMIGRSPNRFVTFLKSTTLGGGPGLAAAVEVATDAAGGVEDNVAAVLCGLTGSPTRLLLGRPEREEAALEEEERPIDPVGEQPDDEQDEDDVLRHAAPLARHQQEAEPVLCVDQLGEH